MTEKEFLIKFIKTFAPKEEEHHSGSEEYMSEYVNEFLEEHHKEYFEVEFIKRVYEGEVDWEKVHPIECANQDRIK